ncbi:N-acetylmuramoyl-L-alanine amidase [Culicoidibacter larvae]|uniref:N-acetylmuramoyl-L-alanine amidase n=1 Tax=Culicoidibacter larvae TaxID=2579976 RepID=UPI001485659B|nr:N-acetylmuramoyl-L-alanine amidase [Culicoidibacter larvae]
MSRYKWLNVIGFILVSLSIALVTVLSVQALFNSPESEVLAQSSSVADLLDDNEDAEPVESLLVNGGLLYVGDAYLQTPYVDVAANSTNGKYYVLISQEEVYYYTRLDAGDAGISFADVADGLYTLKTETDDALSQILYVGETKTLSFYTVRVNGYAKKIIIEATKDSVLKIVVSTVAADSFDDADIVLDPGHGNIVGSEQPGACSDYIDAAYFGGSCEREVMLVVSQYIGERLEDHGLVVDYTRTSDDTAYEPTSGYTNAEYDRDDWEFTKADEVAKTTTVLASNAKLSLSLHFNESDAGNQDLDVYQSIFKLDTAVSSAKAGVQDNIGEDLQNALKTSNSGDIYLLERDYCLAYDATEEEEDCTWGEYDYYYPIREYGGAFTNAMYMDNNIAYNTYEVSPEALLIELFNGANSEEVKQIEYNLQYPNANSRLEAIVKAIVEHYGVDYVGV